MKLRTTLNTLLIYIITLQFAFGPSLAYASACGYEAGTTEYANELSGCPAGQEWDCDLGRCRNTEATEGTRDDYLACAELPADQQQACYLGNADNAAADAGMEGTGGAGAGWTNTLTLGNAVVMIVLLSLAAKDGAMSDCNSAKVMAAAGTIGVLGEIYVYTQTKDKMDDLRNSYNNTALSDNPYDAQVAAFEYLKKEQETIAEVAKKKKEIYSLVTGLYALTIVVAAFDLYPSMKIKCNTKVSSWDQNKNFDLQWDEQYFAITTEDPLQYYLTLQESLRYTNNAGEVFQSPSLDEYDLYKTSNIFDDNSPSLTQLFRTLNNIIASSSTTVLDALLPSAYADDPPATPTSTPAATDGRTDDGDAELPWYGLLTGVFVGAAIALQAGKKVMGKMLATPWTIMGMAALGGLLANQVREKASDQEDAAEANADKITQIMAAFAENMAGFCPGGRNDISNPQCYCYLDGGGQNPSRTNSETCQNLWAARARNYHVGSTNYATATSEPKGCMTHDGKFDKSCQCRKYVSKRSGENACMKAPSLTNVKGMGQATFASSTLAATSQVYNGALGSGTLNSNALGQSAAKLSKLAEQVVDKRNKDRIAQGKKPLPDRNELAEKLYKKVATPAFLDTAAKVYPSTPGLGSTGPKNDALKNALAKVAPVKKDLKYDTGKKKAKAATGDDFDFQLANSGSGEKSEVIDMDQKYDYGNNDIVQNEDASIWNVISKRYTTSGLRRLFGDDVITK